MTEIALITGAAKRIGRHIALELAKAGYDIAIHYNGSHEEAENLKAEILSLGQQAACFQADLSKEEETQSLVPRICQHFGKPSVLINNASLFEEDDITNVTRKSWDLHMETNLRAPFILSQALANNTGYGHIINMIDQRVLNLTPHFMSYTLSKAGLWTLTQTMASALAPAIQVNAIGPGPTLPNQRQDDDDFKEQWQSIPLERPTPLDDISNAILFLLKSRSTTGQLILLDGGEHLGWAQPKDGVNIKE
ncbi:SDR family oxidoreductase [Curvivirga aplysinae]|uniref:SDR family oxidoreductase n=1 Tax=Curvivirga aplysinae TaxID=2529852 RepID=UPI0012BC1089|nr:SDR family oxidoreductase [Curvivirga aplysinae]MTI10225.1 SDR family oxidoreductase [Curvivirga aplysinae]